MLTCPECKGRGTLINWASESVPCPNCKGVGQLQELVRCPTCEEMHFPIHECNGTPTTAIPYEGECSDLDLDDEETAFSRRLDEGFTGTVSSNREATR